MSPAYISRCTTQCIFRWTPFDPTRNYPDLGARFTPHGELEIRNGKTPVNMTIDLSWSAVLKRTFEAYVRGEQPNMYGEWIRW